MDNAKGTTWRYHTSRRGRWGGHGALSFDGNGLGNMTGIVRTDAPAPRHIPITMSLPGRS